uniref:FTH domain-containing protein n=1 Tax=Steinernema glaseri TaxID=37863 RepID=A0A1I7XWH9_9BILA
MESVPVAFVDALCATLKKENLEKLQQIEELWTLTVTTHYSKRREFRVTLYVNPEGTEVEIKVEPFGVYGSSFNHKSLAWSKYDRIIEMDYIEMNQFDQFEDQPLKMPMERFRTKVLPVLTSLADDYGIYIYVSERYPQHLTDEIFSFLRAPARVIDTGHAGAKCVEFIEKQIALGRLRKLDLRGQQWPASIKAPLKSFLKSPSFLTVHLERTNLTVDLDMLACIVETLFKGDLRKNISPKLLVGNLSKEMRDLHCKSLRGDTLPLLDGLSTRPQTCRLDNNEIFWSGPGQKKLFVHFFDDYWVRIYQD